MLILHLSIEEYVAMSTPTVSRYVVPAMTCGHCVAAITGEVTKVAGVAEVQIDLETKIVEVRGSSFDHADIRAAIDEAGFDVVQ
jgi:copper chaperone